MTHRYGHHGGRRKHQEDSDEDSSSGYETVGYQDENGGTIVGFDGKEFNPREHARGYKGDHRATREYRADRVRHAHVYDGDVKVIKVDRADVKVVQIKPDSKGCITDEIKKNVLAVWKSEFPDAVISKELSTPDVLVLTHTMGPGHKTYINGLLCKSPLCNNALLSIECAADSTGKKHWLSMYEIMVPDIPGRDGSPSTSDIYIMALNKQGLHQDGDHYHWKGQSPFAHAIHHKAINMDPVTFSQKSVAALKVLKAAI